MINKKITRSSQFVHHGELEGLVSIHVFSNSDNVFLNLLLQRQKVQREFALIKQGKLRFPVSPRRSILKVLKKLLKRSAAMAVLKERDQEEDFWSWISLANYFSICPLLAVQNGEITLQIPKTHHFKGFRLNPRHDFYLYKHNAVLRVAEQPESEEKAESHALVALTNVGEHKDDNSSFNHNSKAILLSSISLIRRDLPEASLGWPLRRKKSIPYQEDFRKPEARKKSAVEWAMSLPNRSVVNQISLHSNETCTTSRNPSKDFNTSDCKTEKADEERKQKDRSYGIGYDIEVAVFFITQNLEPYSKPGWPLLHFAASNTSIEPPPSEKALVPTEVESPEQIYLPALRKMPKDLELRCKQFSLKELKQATCEFSSENLIGEGGCSNVYKGYLPGGKTVAVKILKSYKESWNDFSLEVDILSSMKHKHITPLIGVCLEDDQLISVYEFFPRGSLEEVLHGQSKDALLPWRVRFEVATSIAEALNYLHNECSPSVIHRDVKSSNILLSDDLQAQLSDFGLAIWGAKDQTCLIDSNVVGTFGYIAPEYFMQGRVSDKIDVYSFGVVLLELLSGRRPISSKGGEGQESLIQWASPLLQKENLEELLDPALNADFDAAQMKRMVFAAFLCLNQSDENRPKINQILEILRGEESMLLNNCLSYDLEVPNQQDVSLFVHNLGYYLSFPFANDDSTSNPFADDDSTSKLIKYAIATPTCSAGKRRRLRLKDYLKKSPDQPL